MISLFLKTQLKKGINRYLLNLRVKKVKLEEKQEN